MLAAWLLAPLPALGEPIAGTSVAPAARSWGVVDIAVDGYGDATMWAPSGKRERAMPVVVALHGLRGRADWTCRIARQLFEDRAFILCPAGVVLPPRTPVEKDVPRYTFRDAIHARAEVEAGLAALRSEYGDSVDTRSPVLYGHSLGASFGAALAREAPTSWSRLLLSEGGYSGWGGAALAYARRESTRVAFACGTEPCFEAARAAARALDGHGAAAKVAYARGAGHRSWGPIVDVMRDEIDWLLDGDARF